MTGLASAQREIKWRLRFLVFVASLLFACTTIRLVSEYDESVDKGVSEIHTKVAAFVGRMAAAAGKPEGTYAANAPFYTDLQALRGELPMASASSPIPG